MYLSILQEHKYDNTNATGFSRLIKQKHHNSTMMASICGHRKMMYSALLLVLLSLVQSKLMLFTCHNIIPTKHY